MNSFSILEMLESQIASGALRPGSKIPSERALAKRFASSRQAVREALAELRSKGAIETRHGHGSTVRNLIDAPDYYSAIEGLYDVHPKMLYDILEARDILESKAAYFAAARAGARDRYRIEQAYRAMQKASAAKLAPEAHSQADFEFHRAIAAATQSPVLAHMLDSLSRLFAKSVRVSVDNLYGRLEERRKIDDQHFAIFTAIMSRDAHAAEAAARLHIESVRTSLERIEQNESGLVRN